MLAEGEGNSMTTAIFSGLGVVMMLVGIFFFSHTRQFLARAQTAKGTVTQMVYSHSSEGGGGYAPVYQFTTADGQSIVKQDSMASNPPRFQVGQELDILYDAAKPQKARINRKMNLYFLPTLFWGMGLIFTGVGVAIQLG
jgi:hypothetical protein